MESAKGIEVILSGFKSNPSCSHGPTILFKRTVNGKEQKFYACSACRDRKDCNFFLDYEEGWTTKKQERWESRRRQLLSGINHSQLLVRFKQVLQLNVSDRSYCHTCSALVLAEERSIHMSHDVTNSISDHQLSHPSELLKPLESAKKEAQYLFAQKSTRAIVEMLRSSGVRGVLCVGAPRVHEYVTNVHSSDMKSMLLDFDHRYHQFYEASDFAWFNAFNCHWFWGEEGKAATVKFMQGVDKLAIVTDPPFGGRVEPLASTFQCIDDLHRGLHPKRAGPLFLMWIFPYFMEPMVLGSCSDMTMLDYKVDYDNHPLFQQGQRGRKYGSPVRIFTNIPPSKLPLPADEGYRFCEHCEKWVSTENRHCFKCASCTSKDGRTYVHCDKCARCVKPTWQHCKQCQRCCLPEHKCGEFKPSDCFACHRPGHKKSDCPLRNSSEGEHSANRVRTKKKSGKNLSAINLLQDGNKCRPDADNVQKSKLGKRKYPRLVCPNKKKKT